MSTATTPNFCSQCGSSLSPGDAFCSQCGAAVEETTATGRASTGANAAEAGPSTGANAAEAGLTAGTTESRHRTDSVDASTPGYGRSAFQRRIENMAVEGWEVQRDYGDRVVMVDRGFGSAIVHAVLLFPTWGIGNAIYAWYNYAPGADRVELRDDGTARYVSGGEGRFESSSGVGYGAGADPDEAGQRDDESGDSLFGDSGSVVTSVVLGIVGLGMLSDAASATTALVGLALLAGALLVLPPVRQRLADRRSISTFGRVRTTDEEVVDAPDVPCAVCSRPVGTGVRRTFAEKLFVAGVPVAVAERGENCYCRSCAQGDPFTDDFAFEGTRGESVRGEATAEIDREL